MCMVRRSSCLTQQLSEVRLYCLKLSNQNLNTIRLGVLKERFDNHAGIKIGNRVKRAEKGG